MTDNLQSAPNAHLPETLFEFALQHLRQWHGFHIVVNRGYLYLLFEENDCGLLERYRSDREPEEGLTREQLFNAIDALDYEAYLAMREQEDDADEEDDSEEQA